MVQLKALIGLAAAFWLSLPALVNAEGLLDGRVFSGVIGPAENPDLDDSLHFNDGYFWSDICTRCGFVPGIYEAEATEDGVRFTGVLESDSRGQFTYEGLARADGTLEVRIRWERKRWYWTTRRDIVFRGRETVEDEVASLTQIRDKMAGMDPGSNPLCARF